ncbi:hypothetical protein Z517_08719 [Fonsecaea pedrosoi CBS 271.37]|uniref:Uncharacterized protein n=1 Tax=Fonsecaea pedrosoi CBS 271.37 TaxID=1442368 RepID=A0A0D2GK11_9EURO|nr:uncharacterized protein Z517_08719 [Fonsecaea pedrosoi CBS 271.37]KIW78880.1 hypothetical protein Z517_08719 [Fonsecaea pedrosoi CBS 271.37]
MSVDSRAGDIVGTSEKYNQQGMYAKHEDILLRLDGGDTEVVTNISATVTLRFEKGEKYSNDNRTRRVESFKVPSYNCVDFILL